MTENIIGMINIAMHVAVSIPPITPVPITPGQAPAPLAGPGEHNRG